MTNYKTSENVTAVQLPSFYYNNSSYHGRPLTSYEINKKKPLPNKHNLTICELCNFYFANRHDPHVFRKTVQFTQSHDDQTAIEHITSALRKGRRELSTFEYNKNLLSIYQAFQRLSPVTNQAIRTLRNSGEQLPSDHQIKKLFWAAKAVTTLYEIGGDNLLYLLKDSYSILSIDQTNVNTIINFIQTTLENCYVVYMSPSCANNDNVENDELEDY